MSLEYFFFYSVARVELFILSCTINSAKPQLPDSKDITLEELIVRASVRAVACRHEKAEKTREHVILGSIDAGLYRPRCQKSLEGWRVRLYTQRSETSAPAALIRGVCGKIRYRRVGGRGCSCFRQIPPARDGGRARRIFRASEARCDVNGVIAGKGRDGGIVRSRKHVPVDLTIPLRSFLSHF